MDAVVEAGAPSGGGRGSKAQTSQAPSEEAAAEEAAAALALPPHAQDSPVDAIDAILAQARRIRSDSKRIAKGGSVATTTTHPAASTSARATKSSPNPNAAHKPTAKATAKSASTSATANSAGGPSAPSHAASLSQAAASAASAAAAASSGIAPTRASRRWALPSAFQKEIARHVASLPTIVGAAAPAASSTPSLGSDAELAFNAALRSHGARQYRAVDTASTSASAYTPASAASTAVPHAVRRARLVATIQSQLWVLQSLRTTLPWAMLRDPATPTANLAVFASLLAGTLRCDPPRLLDPCAPVDCSPFWHAHLRCGTVASRDVPGLRSRI